MENEGRQRAIFSIKGSEIDVALLCGGRVGERVIKTVTGLVTKFEVDHIPGLFCVNFVNSITALEKRTPLISGPQGITWKSS